MIPSKYNSTNKGIPYITGASNFVNESIIVNRWTEYPTSKAKYGDLLITCKGTIGKMAYLNEKEAHIARQVMAISTSFPVNLEFLKIYLEIIVPVLQKNAKSFIPGISRADIVNLILPVPPYQEQFRIINKVETLFSIIDKIS